MVIAVEDVVFADRPFINSFAAPAPPAAAATAQTRGELALFRLRPIVLFCDSSFSCPFSQDPRGLWEFFTMDATYLHGLVRRDLRKSFCSCLWL